jgi:hypothetical protein
VEGYRKDREILSLFRTGTDTMYRVDETTMQQLAQQTLAVRTIASVVCCYFHLFYNVSLMPLARMDSLQL